MSRAESPSPCYDHPGFDTEGNASFGCEIWGDLSGQQQASIGQTMFLGTCFSSRKKRKAVLKKACMR